MKEEKENKSEKIEETKEQLIQSNQVLETQLRILQDEMSLKDEGVYRRQHLLLLSEQNQTLKGIGLALNRIGMKLENSEEEEGEEPDEEEEVAEEVEEEVKEEPEEESKESVSREEKKLQKKIDKITAKLKKVKSKEE